MPITEAFAEIVKLAERRGVARINDLPGCWEPEIGGEWKIALNGHREPAKSSSGAEVPPFSAYIEYNGWPAGVIDPSGGIIAAGECANEDAFIAALRAAH